MTASEAFLDFFRAAGALKDTARNSWTRTGRRESVAEHSWRLALMAVALEDDLPGVDHKRLLQMLILHDLGEAISGDIPAPLQGGADKRAAERADLAQLIAPLPPRAAARLAALWDECAAAQSAEARLAKGLDRLETVLQHVEGANPPDFDYGFNLAYGRELTDAHPLIAALRAPVDAETARRAGEGETRLAPPGRRGHAPASRASGAAPMTTYVFPPAPPPSIAVHGREARFPVGRIFCVGRNYEAHAVEMGGAVDREAPFYFTKSPTAAIPSGGVAAFPPGTQDYHHEVELAVAIGAEGEFLTPETAMGLVFGYACALDMTRRDLQAAAKAARRPWDLGKDVEDSAIIAPIAPADEVGPLASGRIWLEVDGVLRQDADVADMVWSVPDILAHLSGYYRLRPGDLVLTGTPAGVGPVAPGAHLRGGVAGLPELEVTIGAAV